MATESPGLHQQASIAPQLPLRSAICSLYGLDDKDQPQAADLKVASLNEARRLFGIDSIDEVEMLVDCFREVVSIVEQWHLGDSDESAS